ncbi:hypothetical protein CB1_000284010 [Camelus ferus]|nr:hypothetical protein CB1_000284010 [Camelus ferus]
MVNREGPAVSTCDICGLVGRYCHNAHPACEAWCVRGTGQAEPLCLVLREGSVATLRALNLRHCPLEFPPPLIVQKGLGAILTFLRICAAEHASPQGSAPRGWWDSCYSKLRGPAASRALVGSGRTAEADLLPPVEKLGLSELGRSTDSLEDWPSKEEIQRFWKLRQEIVENEQAGVRENQLLPVELPPNLKAALSAEEKPRPAPRPVFRGKRPSFKSILPDLAASRQALVHVYQLEQSRDAALRELWEKQVQTEQRRRDRRALQEWREQTRVMRSRRRELSRVPPLQRNLVRQGPCPECPVCPEGRVPEASPAAPPSVSSEQVWELRTSTCTGSSATCARQPGLCRQPLDPTRPLPRPPQAPGLATWGLRLPAVTVPDSPAPCSRR